MPSSEDYTVVWVGVCEELRPDEVDAADSGTHPLMRRARDAGLESWFDTFDVTPRGDRIFHLLIGARIEVLGYKEGTSRLAVSRSDLIAQLDRVDAGLRAMGMTRVAELH